MLKKKAHQINIRQLSCLCKYPHCTDGGILKSMENLSQPSFEIAWKKLHGELLGGLPPTLISCKKPWRLVCCPLNHKFGVLWVWCGTISNRCFSVSTNENIRVRALFRFDTEPDELGLDTWADEGSVISFAHSVCSWIIQGVESDPQLSTWCHLLPRFPLSA